MKEPPSTRRGSQPFRIGFVDHDLDNFHANVFLEAFRKPLADRRAAVTGCWAQRAGRGRAWARARGLPYCGTVADLDALVDAYMILAPSNPEVHLALCRKVLPFGKPTYVDKTFAPDRATARRIFALADKHGVPVQTSSALRYTNVQSYLRDIGPATVGHMAAWGGGSSFGEYAIHPVELVVSCLGPGAVSLMRRGRGAFSQLLLNFTRGRTAVVNVHLKAEVPYAASVTSREETRYIPVDTSALFVDTASAVLDFLRVGKPDVDRAETLVIRRILDVAGQARARDRFVRL